MRTKPAQQPTGMVDLHCHILPGIDDGPADLSGALDLADAAASAGTSVVAATPHVREDHPRVDVYELADRCLELNRSIGDAAIPVRVVAAAEVDLVWACEASAEELRLASYGQHGTDILIETPRGLLPPHFEKLVFGIRARGYRVLLAHPERNRSLREDRQRLLTLVQAGVLLQLDASSLSGGDGSSRSRAAARALIRARMAHVIASDSHTAHGWRPPSLQPALAAVERADRGWAKRLVSDWPSAILRGEDLPRDSAEAARRSRWFPRARRRAADAAF